MACDKVRYKTGAQARRALQSVKKMGKKAGDKPRRAYHCDGCGGWHLTKNPTWK